ncbi:hypothetical protein ASG63_00735 [Methylobacterium sp. Leaf94]|jgi:hypothetical protein|nr:hypothetical protein ASF20_02875 [Methylobacterium sp. Leaf88]KQU35201.1 hypothetical protein ASG63_00735 [Methylobacterium sp. Leaf94]
MFRIILRHETSALGSKAWTDDLDSAKSHVKALIDKPGTGVRPTSAEIRDGISQAIVYRYPPLP